MGQRYADWMYADESFAIDSQIETICSSLQTLKNNYGRYLDDDAIKGNINCLESWLESYRAGSYEAQIYLRNYGAELLSHIHDNLSLTADDMRRFDAESPAGQNFTGGKAERLSQAASEVAAIQGDVAKAVRQ